MFQALLLAGILAAPLGSAVLFLPARRHARGAGTWPAVRRFTLAVIGTAVLAAAVAVILRALGASERNLVAGKAAGPQPVQAETVLPDVLARDGDRGLIR